MITFTLEAILAIFLVIVLMRLFRKDSKPAAPAYQAPVEDLANLKVTDARVGDVLSIAGGGGGPYGRPGLHHGSRDAPGSGRPHLGGTQRTLPGASCRAAPWRRRGDRGFPALLAQSRDTRRSRTERAGPCRPR